MKATDERLEAAVVANCQRLVNDWYGSAVPRPYMEVIQQRRAKGSGSTIGAPDAVLYHRGRPWIIEFKRPHGGRLDNGQVLAIRCRLAAGVDTYVVSNEQEFADLLSGRLRPHVP